MTLLHHATLHSLQIFSLSLSLSLSLSTYVCICTFVIRAARVSMRMPQVPATAPSQRTSAYLFALTQEIEKKLQRALASPSQRRNLLQGLFADIALEVDDRARDIILSREDLISSFEDGAEGPLCFYDVLADYFVWEPEKGNPILDLIVQLWSQSFASHIFSLLFHKW
ncbi:unnamed protein product [Camellia sinensis]